MNYEDLTFDYLRDLAINNVEEFRKIPLEHIRSTFRKHELEEAKKKGYLIDDSGICFPEINAK